MPNSRGSQTGILTGIGAWASCSTPCPSRGVSAGGGPEPVGPVAADHFCGRWTIIPTMSHALFQTPPSMAGPSIRRSQPPIQAGRSSARGCYRTEARQTRHGAPLRPTVSIHILLKKGAGLTDSKENPHAIGSSLDDLCGVWKQDEAESFDAALEIFETVDESAWT